jgi:hypothetical protein
MGIRFQVPLLLVMFSCLIVLSAPYPQNYDSASKIIIPKADPFEHQVPIPPAVLEVLLNDDSVKSSVARMTDYQRDKPSELFFASEARLGRPDEIDYIVGGMPPLCGASSDFYWVVRPTAQKPEVVLVAGGKAIEFMVSRSHGYRDIRTVGGTIWILEENLYRFNGKEYKLWKKRSESRR